MIISLLLQTVTHQETITVSDLTNVYIALGGTLFASILAAIASFRASSKASITAEKVAALTTQTAKDVANLSAQVTRESAALAANTAKEIKDKEYKNDFYKKIIEKRLASWSNAENLMNILGAYVVDDNDKKSLPGYFASWKTYSEALERVNKHDMESIWISREYSENMTNYLNILYDIKVKFDGGQDESVNYSSKEALSYLYENGKEHHEKLHLMWKKSMRMLGREVAKLDDLKTLFQELSELGDLDD